MRRRQKSIYRQVCILPLSKILYNIEESNLIMAPDGEGEEIPNMPDTSVIAVVGHQNPDTDSIASPIAYAWLKSREEPNETFRAFRLGPINRETRFVLEYFGVEEPPLLDHVHRRVREAMVTEVITAPVDATSYEVGFLMREKGIRSVPLVDEDNRPHGVVTTRTLAELYIHEAGTFSFASEPPTVAQVVRTLEGELLVGTPDVRLTGRPVIGAMTPALMRRYIRPGDVVIVANRTDAQRTAIENRASALIISGGIRPRKMILAKAREQGTVVILSPHTTATTMRLVRLSLPAIAMAERAPLMFGPNELLGEITSDLMQDRHGVALVVDNERLVGILTRHDLLRPRRRRVILIDHSEPQQTVPGIEEADILEIIDHHRLGGLETQAPLRVLVLPVGCSATLILHRYREVNVTPPRDMAGLMLAAILSDTMLLRSPTTTEMDRTAVDFLAPLAGVDAIKFGTDMYRAKTDISDLSAWEIVTGDMKPYVLNGISMAIAQVEVADREQVMARLSEFKDALHRLADQGKYELAMLLVTDVLAEGSTVIAVGNTRVVERAFGVTLKDGIAWLPGVLSRKKQVVPALAEA